MKNIVDRQTVIISVNLSALTTGGAASIATLPMILRFPANELVVKSIGYNVLNGGGPDLESTVQIWCNVTTDNLIATFTNTSTLQVQHNEHFLINNAFQTGNLILQFQDTENGNPASYNPQRLISQIPGGQRTYGTVCLTLEFLKWEK